MSVKILQFRRAYYGQSVSENSVFWTNYTHKCTDESIASNWSKLTKIRNNSNNGHFSAVRFICSPDLAIKLTLASLQLILISDCCVIVDLVKSIKRAWDQHYDHPNQFFFMYFLHNVLWLQPLKLDKYLPRYSRYEDCLEPDVHDTTSQVLSILIDYTVCPLYHFFNPFSNI